MFQGFLSKLLEPSQHISILKDRAQLFSDVRAFFTQRKVVEVDCPIITQYAAVDQHIDLITAHCGKEIRYLHSSPEYGMKRLLVKGMGDIYQMSHVFRDSELGKKHNPEFTMIEWYRHALDYEAMMQETVELLSLFLGPLKSETLSYQEAFLQFTGLDYIEAEHKELLELFHTQQIPHHDSLADEESDTLLQMLFSALVEPQFSPELTTIIKDFPATQAALAKIDHHGKHPVAKRFEIYYSGMELANGYDELLDAEELLGRFHLANTKRIASNKSALPIDHALIDALKEGLPQSCGVAVGFDRLMMLRHHVDHIESVIPFYWTQT